VDLPVVFGPDVAQGRGDAALGTPIALASIAARRPAPPAPITITSYS